MIGTPRGREGERREGEEMRKTSVDYDEPLLIIWKLTSPRRHLRRGLARQLWARDQPTLTVIHGSDRPFNAAERERERE